MNYRIDDLIDISLLQRLQEKLDSVYSFPSAIIDNEGKVLTAVSWQDICTKFHRINPESKKECIKSDQYIFEHLHEANPAITCQCPHGLIDNAIPIIIDGKHLANFFTGQFFLEKPDLKFFKKQAIKYGFDEESYLKAVEKVPVWTKEKLANYIDFIKEFIEVIAGLGLKNLTEIETRKRIFESEEKYRLLYDSNQMPISIYDTETLKFLSVNHAFVEKYGYTREEFLNMTILDIRPDSEINRVKESVKVEDNGLVNVGVFLHKKKNGEIIQVEIIRHDIDFEGRKSKLVFVNDITDKIKAENILKEKNQFLTKLTNSLESVVFTVDLINRKIIYVNNRVEAVFGYIPDECIGNSTRFLYPDKKSFIEYGKQMQNSIQKNQQFLRVENTLRKKNGELFSTDIMTSFLDKTKVVAVIKDITDKKKAEEELVNNKKSLEMLYNRLEDIRESERSSLSRELHDQLGQSLTALKMDIVWLSKKIPGGSEEDAKIMGIVELINSTIKDVQRISAELRPAILVDLGLCAAIEWYCSEFKKRTGIDFDLKLNDNQIPDEKISLVLYRILQEALTNVARHAEAKNVDINLFQADDSVILEVIDDGIGLKKGKLNSFKSLGFIGMRERAKNYNGTVDISSTLKKGTKLSVSIPLN